MGRKKSLLYVHIVAAFSNFNSYIGNSGCAAAGVSSAWLLTSSCVAWEAVGQARCRLGLAVRDVVNVVPA